MIQKLDKTKLLERYLQQNPYFTEDSGKIESIEYAVEFVSMFVSDMSDKLNEVIDHLNVTHKLVDSSTVHDTTSDNDADVVQAFTNPGESIIKFNDNGPLAYEGPAGAYDVVYVRQVDAGTTNLAKTLRKALDISRQRTIIGVHKSVSEEFEMFLAGFVGHWERYEHDTTEDVDYYVLDKVE